MTRLFRPGPLSSARRSRIRRRASTRQTRCRPIARGSPGGPQPNSPPSLLAVPANAAKKILTRRSIYCRIDNAAQKIRQTPKAQGQKRCGKHEQEHVPEQPHDEHHRTPVAAVHRSSRAIRSSARTRRSAKSVAGSIRRKRLGRPIVAAGNTHRRPRQPSKACLPLHPSVRAAPPHWLKAGSIARFSWCCSPRPAASGN
jgi:hypothetical protein